MTKNPLISIITVNLNNLVGLKVTTKSVLEQKWREFEYIIIDGGSVDGCKEYLELHQNEIDYWISEPDKGIYNAMNKGIQFANGEYLLFLNSGDCLIDKEVLLRNFEKVKNYDFIYFNLKIIGCDSSFVKEYPSNLRFSFFLNDSLPHPSTFIKASLFDKLGLYDDRLKIVSDWKFFITALFLNNCSYKKINSTLSVFNRDGISFKTDNLPEREIVLKEFFPGFIEDYHQFFNFQKQMTTNRFRLLQELEKSFLGQKVSSVFFRIFITLFSKKKIKDIIS